MTPMEIVLLFAIAALAYQEISWRDKARRIQADYEKRISTEVAMAYETSLADDGRPVRALTFQAEKQEPRGLFHEVTRHLFIAVTMNGDAVKYAAGDLNEIERFSIPPGIRRTLVEFVSPARVGERGSLTA
jgi:Flp pilus assembly protein TadB